MDAIAARDARDDDLLAAAPAGGSGSGGGNAKTALQPDPKARLHIKTSVKVLTAREGQAASTGVQHMHMGGYQPTNETKQEFTL